MTLQKWGLVVVLVIVAGFLTYLAYQNGWHLPSALFSPSPTPSPSSSPTRTPTPSRKPSPTVSGSMTPGPSQGAQAQVLAAMNARRNQAGVGALSTNAILQAEAQRHASDMAARAYFSHTTPEGKTFAQRMAETSYPSTMVAENIALTSDAPATVVDQWMASSVHRDNMLNAAYVATGVGVANGTYQGQAVVYVVAIFGDTP